MLIKTQTSTLMTVMTDTEGLFTMLTVKTFDVYPGQGIRKQTSHTVNCQNLGCISQGIRKQTNYRIHRETCLYVNDPLDCHRSTPLPIPFAKV